MLPSSVNHTLISFFTRVEQELGSISTPRRKTYSNLTLKEKAALNDLKNNQTIIFKPCDKGLYLTLDYLTKIDKQLQNYNTYKLLTHNPTNAIVHNARTLLHYMYCQHIIDTATMEFYCLPGIHPHLSSMSYQKYTNQTALSALLL